MKILHTSDWHLGHVLYGYDRYHTSQPSSTVQRMFTDAVMNMHSAHPSMKIVITAGNHDSGTRHEIFQTAWNRFNTVVVGTLCKTDISEHIVEIPGKGFILAVPYASQKMFPENFFNDLLDLAEKRHAQLFCYTIDIMLT